MFAFYPVWALPGDRRHPDGAAELDRLRENWLNPPEWIAEIEKLVDLKYRTELAAVPAESRPLVRRSAIMAEAVNHGTATIEGLKHRTLTRLYNQRPAWLRHAHEKLDRAVLAAYAATDPKGAPSASSDSPHWDLDWAKAYEPFGAGEIEIRRPPPPGAKRGKRATFDEPEAIAAKEAALAARKPIDARILANLLRLNHARASA